MDFTLFLIVLFALQGICLIAGSRNSNKMKNQKDYFLANKEVSFFPLLMTFIATQVGGGLILGSAEEAYQFGWFVFLYPLGACLGFLLLACGIGKRLSQFHVSTVAQLFETVYKSTVLKKIASLLSIISLFMVLIAQVIASKKFMVSLGLDQNAIFLLFWGLIIIYTAIGGLKAIVSIDIIQAVFFIVVFLGGFGYVLLTQDSSPTISSYSGNFDFDSSKLSGWLFMPLLFMVIEQDMAQRCFAAKSPKVVTKAAIWSAIIILFISIIPIFFGIIGKNLGIEIKPGSSVFMSSIQALTSPKVAAFVGCAVIMAVISTAISLINAVSSNITQDFELPIKISNIKKSQVITALIGICAVIFSFYFDRVLDLMIQSYELSVYCLFVPVFVILFKKIGNKQSAILSIAFGAIGFFLFRYYSIGIPKEIASVGLSALGYGIGEILALMKSRDAYEQAALQKDSS